MAVTSSTPGCHRGLGGNSTIQTAAASSPASPTVAQVIRRRASSRAGPNAPAAAQQTRARAIQGVNEGFGVSKAERKCSEIFRGLGFTIRTQLAGRAPDGTFVFVYDFFLPNRNLLIEFHGSYWHGG